MTDRERSLKKMINENKANLLNHEINVVYRSWNFQPSKNMSVQPYDKEFNKRLQNFSENPFLIPGVEIQIKILLLYHFNWMQPALASRCREYSLQSIISEFLHRNSPSTSNSAMSIKNIVKCNFCKNLGHLKDYCNKKMKRELHKSQHAGKQDKNVLSPRDFQNDSVNQ